MKFENIKVGDTVFIPEHVRVDWRNYETFYLAKKVIKVTKTQFTIEGGQRYGKMHGAPIGEGSGEAMMQGDKVFGKTFGGEVKDQTKELKEFKQKIDIEQEIKKELESLKNSIYSNCPIPLSELQEIYKKINEIRATVNSYSPF